VTLSPRGRSTSEAMYEVPASRLAELSADAAAANRYRDALGALIPYLDPEGEAIIVVREALDLS